MPDFGISLSCVSDFTPDFAVVTGRRLLAEAAVRRITTPRGQLIDDPNYGIDVRDFVLDGLTPIQMRRIPGLIDAELQKDARINASTTTIQSFANGVMVLGVTLDPGDGPFSLVISVTQLTVDLLTVTP